MSLTRLLKQRLQTRLLIAMTVLAPVPPVLADAANAYQTTLSGWQETLSRFVDSEGRTDFLALADDADGLLRFVEAIAGFGPASHPEAFPAREDVLAYHINAYNALAMHGVIERDVPENFSSFFKRASFFKFRTVTVAGKKTNLYDYENKVIRPLGEPRVHFALNCMVRDCPRLPREVFTAASLHAQLESAAVEFFGKERHLRIDTKKRTVYVSAILDFYTEDFVASGKRDDLGAYINRYRAEPLPPGYRIRFSKYDWTVNQQP